MDHSLIAYRFKNFIEIIDSKRNTSAICKTNADINLSCWLNITENYRNENNLDDSIETIETLQAFGAFFC